LSQVLGVYVLEFQGHIFKANPSINPDLSVNII
jgi:hypothetical protein